MGLRSLLRGRRGSVEDRDARARLAAAEAAQDDPLFDPGHVLERAEFVFVAIQRAWSRDDVPALRQLVGPELMVEWEARLDDFRRRGWRNLVDVLDGPTGRYVGVVNRAGDAEDRVVVFLTARLRDVVLDRWGTVLPNNEGEVARIGEYWTLGKRDGDWVVVSIEQEREGAGHLSEPLVASPAGDDARLRADATMEVAGADWVPAGQVAEYLSPAFSGSARAAALDLSLIDGRLAPDVIATAVTEVIAAWADAIDGPDEPLAAWTTRRSLQALLYPIGSSRSRLVIRGAQLQEATIVEVIRGPPTQVRLELAIRGVQYVEDRDTAEIVLGTARRPTTTRQRWILQLVDDPRRPWIVVDAAGVIPGRR